MLLSAVTEAEEEDERGDEGGKGDSDDEEADDGWRWCFVDPRSKGRGCFDGEGAFASDECEGDLRRGKGLAASGTLASVEGIKTTSAGIGGGVGERLGLMFVTLRFRASRCSKDDGSKCVSRCRRCQHATLAASRLYVRHLEVQFVNGGGAATEQATSVRNRVLVGERSASGASGCAERSPRQHMRVRQSQSVKSWMWSPVGDFPASAKASA